MRIKRDKQSIKAVRALMAQPHVLGSTRVREMSDEQVARAAEEWLDRVARAMPKLNEAAEKMGAAWSRAAKQFAALGRAVSKEKP